MRKGQCSRPGEEGSGFQTRRGRVWVPDQARKGLGSRPGEEARVSVPDQARICVPDQVSLIRTASDDSCGGGLGTRLIYYPWYKECTVTAQTEVGEQFAESA